MIARNILLRGETKQPVSKKLCSPACETELNRSGSESLSLNLTSGDSLRYGVKKGE